MLEYLPKIAAIVTVLFGIWAIVQPKKFADLIALIPKGKRGTSEIRATYGGMIFAMGAFALWSDSEIVYKALGFAWLGIGTMRLLSFFLDGSYSSLNLKVVIFEFVFAAMLLSTFLSNKENSVQLETTKVNMNALIQTPTPNLNSSLEFYKKLNFKVLSEENPTIVTDGKALLEINPDRPARAGVKLYAKDWSVKVEELKSSNHLEKIENGYLLSTPSGCWMYLMEGEFPVDFKPEEKSFGVIGTHYGLSLETTDFQGSIKFWELLDFKIGMGAADQGFVAMFHENGFGVSLMKHGSCPHLFFNPSLSYFNSGKNPEIIAKLRELEIPITEEITQFNKEGIVDNVIIRDPGGLGFFVFND